jgi:hypothetical protein
MEVKTVGNLILLSVLLLIALTGCDRIYFANQHGLNAENISLHLRENYKIGTDEKILIRDFTARGYRYILPNTANKKRRLVYPNPCPPLFYDMGEQVYIAWTSDEKGLISAIEEPKITSCGMSFP